MIYLFSTCLFLTGSDSDWNLWPALSLHPKGVAFSLAHARIYPVSALARNANIFSIYSNLPKLPSRHSAGECLVDLTQSFGKGNSPNSMRGARIGNMLALRAKDERG
uniref:Uncharacterized protein n=1 Tax=Candidatus Kentrum sp. UNK TaxID=2126344 RepID=A0A451B2K4_9GAMM|nr:MAG: hypothetical protein BECKUNK1418G_GA0071005_10682 [Candidatus Kentron sp. UNK]VFK72521.1 MAG: hypothetical protein BECKUNK1418H_GA0071006_11202 [Candidatus Kentron sp. UNK]